MDKNQKKRLRRQFILSGFKNALIVDGIAVVGLSAIAIVVALFKHMYIMKSIYLSFYFGGAFILMVSVPQLYKKGNSAKIKGSSPMFGFYDWFGGSYKDEGINDTYNQFKFEGFWLGIMMVTMGTVLIGLGVILENIFFIQ